MFVTMESLAGRRLITTRGGYIGLAPEEAELGDVIAILHGCNFPLVLRPCGGSYLLIGECYVDGMMDGEMVEARGQRVFEGTEINIC